MATRKQFIVGGAVALVFIAGFLGIQFYRLKNFTLQIKGVDKFKASMKRVSFDVYLDFINKSNLQIALGYQNYKVYINNKLVTTINSRTPQVIHPKSGSVLKASVDLSPADLINKLGGASIENILNIKQQKLKIVVSLGVRYLGITIPINTTIENTIANWIAPNK